jgi:hypothetical protein
MFYSYFVFIEDPITQRKALELCILGILQGACHPLWIQMLALNLTMFLHVVV